MESIQIQCMRTHHQLEMCPTCERHGKRDESRKWKCATKRCDWDMLFNEFVSSSWKLSTKTFFSSLLPFTVPSIPVPIHVATTATIYSIFPIHSIASNWHRSHLNAFLSLTGALTLAHTGLWINLEPDRRKKKREPLPSSAHWVMPSLQCIASHLSFIWFFTKLTTFGRSEQDTISMLLLLLLFSVSLLLFGIYLFVERFVLHFSEEPEYAAIVFVCVCEWMDTSRSLCASVGT